MRKRQFKNLGLAFATVLAMASMACGTTTTHNVLMAQVASPWDGDVAIIMAGAPEPRQAREVAIVQAIGGGTHADLEHLIAGLKKEARKFGCNCIVRVHVDQGSATASATGVAVRVDIDPSLADMDVTHL